MFTDRETASSLTNREITSDLLFRAQSIIETYVGKVDVEVLDSRDRTWLGRATAYQAAYMMDNEDIVYEQIAAKTTGQNDSLISFKDGDNASPWIAPLAVMACKRLTFMNSRSITTGKVSQRRKLYSWRRW